MLTHPRTGKRIWFNQAAIFRWYYSKVIWKTGRYGRAAMMRAWETYLRRAGAAKLAYQTSVCGDGEEIAPSAIDHFATC